MSSLEEEVAAWRVKNPDEAPAAPPAEPQAAPGSRAEAAPPSSPPPPQADQREADDDDQADDEPSETALDMHEVAALGVTLIDYGIQNFVSERCAFKPHQKAELSRLGGLVLDKYFPDVAGAVEPEYAFIGAVALFAYTNYRSSPEPAKKPAGTPSGGEQPNGPSGGPSTEAHVDGKRVAAEVLQ